MKTYEITLNTAGQKVVSDLMNDLDIKTESQLFETILLSWTSMLRDSKKKDVFFNSIKSAAFYGDIDFIKSEIGSLF